MVNPKQILFHLLRTGALVLYKFTTNMEKKREKPSAKYFLNM